MSLTATIRPGDRKQRVYVLSYNDAVLNLTGLTVTMSRRDSAGTTTSINTVSDPTVIAITSASAGEVTVTPGLTFWASGVNYYDVTFTVTVSGKDYKSPEADALRYDIYQGF